MNGHYLYAICLAMASYFPLQAQFTWTNVEKEVSFRYGFTQHHNANVPVEILTNNSQFKDSYAPITTDNTPKFTPTYTQMYGLDFGLRFLFNKYLFSKINIGVNEQLFGFSHSYQDPTVGDVDVTTRIKYFGVPLTAGSGISIPFDWDKQGNVGAVNFFVSGFITPLMSPTGTSGIEVFTREPLDNGTTFGIDSEPIIDVTDGSRLADITGIYGGVVSLSLEFNEVTLTLEYRGFSGFGIVNANPANNPFYDSGKRTDWHGHSIDIGVSFRFY